MFRPLISGLSRLSQDAQLNARNAGAWMRSQRLQTWRHRARALVGGVGIAGILAGVAPAAELYGVTLPDTTQTGGTKLVLNGMGLRTYSMLAVHIYVAGLYLPASSHDPDEILQSPSTKMLVMNFVHDVPAEKIRGAFRDGLTNNCTAPCVLPAAEMSDFLSKVPAVTKGETISLVFSSGSMRAYFDRTPGGTISDPQFARLMLAVFLGPHPASTTLKAGLLGQSQ